MYWYIRRPLYHLPNFIIQNKIKISICQSYCYLGNHTPLSVFLLFYALNVSVRWSVFLFTHKNSGYITSVFNDQTSIYALSKIPLKKSEKQVRNITIENKCSIIENHGVADPVNFFRIRVTQKRPDPTGSGSGSYFDMFFMFSKINNCLWHFYTKYKHLMTLKIKKKIFLTKLYLRQFYITRKLELQGSFCG